MSFTLGAALCLYNGESHDYCWRQTIESLLPACEEIVVAEGESDDGTREALDEWAAREPKLRIVSWPFSKPEVEPLWVMRMYNFAREQLTTSYCITLDCDEVLEEGARDKINEKLAGDRRVSLRIRRWNFWKDAQHLVPEDVCLASEVIRVAPVGLFIPADIPVPQGQACMDIEIPALNIEVHHVGFLRKPEGFFKKARFLQNKFTGGYDPKLEAVENLGGNWMENPSVVEWGDRLQTFTKKHPKVLHQWLRDRGFEPNL